MLEAPNDPIHRTNRASRRGYVQLGLILFAIAVAVYFARAPSRVDRLDASSQSTSESARPTVRVIRPTATDQSLTIELTGSVSLEEKASVASEVVGRVVWVSPNFSNGGSVPADEPFIRIDPTRFELEVEAAAMAVEEAEARVWVERARGEENTRVFGQANPGSEASDWVRRLPKIAEAEAELKKAQAELKLAELRLERTEISLPYDSLVMNSDVEVGELVGPVDLAGPTRLGTVYRPQALQVDAPIEPSDLRHLHPVIGRAARVAGQMGTWRARVVRVSSVVAPRSRLASVFLDFSRAASRDSLPAPGTFVEVKIDGPTHKNVFVLPEASLQERDRVWIVRGGKLNSFEPETVGRTAEGWVVKAFDVAQGVVVGSLPRAHQGLAVTVVQTESAS